jgi:histone H1/5
MTTEPITAAVSPAVKKGRKSNTAKPKASGAKKAAKKSSATYIDMIKAAVMKLAGRNGASRQAIIKYICSNFSLDQKAAIQHTKLALRSGVKSGALKQAKGIGASGSFKIGEKAVQKKKKAAAKTSKTAVAAKPKKAAKKVKEAKPVVNTPSSTTKAAAPKAAKKAKVVKKKSSSAAAKPKVAAAKPADNKPSSSVNSAPSTQVVTQSPKTPAKKIVTKAAAIAKLPSSPTKGRKVGSPKQQIQVKKAAASKRTASKRATATKKN